jgi:hypothetical protein
MHHSRQLLLLLVFFSLRMHLLKQLLLCPEKTAKSYESIFVMSIASFLLSRLSS